MTKEELLEKLSNLEHEQWIAWAVTLIEKEELSPERLERWKGLLVPYEELSEKYKEYDRKWARLILSLLSQYESEKQQELVKEKDNAYWERNQLVALLSKVYPSHLYQDDEQEKEWRNLVCIHTGGDVLLPTGSPNQATWHIHESDLKYFSHLRMGNNHWDGHTTKEKYERLRAIEKVRGK